MLNHREQPLGNGLEVRRLSPGNKELSERKKLILKAIIDTHINMGEPVGSKYLTRYEQITFSPATIRNEMAELEEMGYLEQPHTSAGRVPSQLGYRFYVDSLMQQYRISTSEMSELNKLLKLKAAEIDRILDRATKLMSMLTNYTGLALKRVQNRPTVARFDIMYLSPRAFVLIMLTDDGTVKTRQLRLGFDVTRESLEILSQTLNDCVAGRDMDKITLPVILEMQTRATGCDQLINPIIKTIYETISEPDDSELMFDGVNNLLNYPEYSNIDTVKDVLGLFDDKEELLEVMSGVQNDKTNVYIGSESPVEVMNNSSLIFRSVKSNGKVVGAVGVIGPRRMDYSKVVTLVEYLSRGISRLMDSDNLLDGPEDEPTDKESELR